MPENYLTPTPDDLAEKGDILENTETETASVAVAAAVKKPRTRADRRRAYYKARRRNTATASRYGIPVTEPGKFAKGTNFVHHTANKKRPEDDARYAAAVEQANGEIDAAAEETEDAK